MSKVDIYGHRIEEEESEIYKLLQHVHKDILENRALLLLKTKENDRLLEEIDRLTKIIDRLTRPRQQVKQVLVKIVNHKKVIIMDPLQLNPGTQAPIIPALVDAVTLQPIPGATFVPKSNTVDNPAIASVDANGNLVYVSAGAANLTSVNTWTYVDQNTKLSVTADVTTVSTLQMNAAAEAILQQVGLGTPVPIPTAPAATA